MSILTGILAIALLSHGASVFGNGDLSSTTEDIGGFSFNANDAWAMPFTTGSSSGDDLELSGATVFVGDTDASVAFSIQIFADTGINEGPAGALLATGSATIAAGGYAWQSVNFGSTVILNSNTNYYLAVARGAGGSSEFSWEVPLDDPAYTDQGSGSAYAITPAGTAPQHVWRRSGTWVDSGSSVNSNELGLRLNAVPEPSTMLLGLGAIGFFIRRRR